MDEFEEVEERLKQIGLNRQSYEEACKDIDGKLNGEIDLDWAEIKDKYGITLNPDVIRKASATIFGGTFRAEYEKQKLLKEFESDTDIPDSPSKEIDLKIDELRKERMKLQTLNIERNRINRGQAREELYYEYVGRVVKALNPPEFRNLENTSKPDINYVVGLADIHYGSTFKSLNNEYSPAIAKSRMEYLTANLISFIKEKHLNAISIVSLGDLVQGILRISDLKLNDSTIVKSVVEVCRLVAQMLNALSEYAVIEYYHTPTANHTQLRIIGAKANELGDEDLEYLMGNYIKDLCASNERIHVHLANEGDDFIEIDVPGNDVIAMHGHQIKSIEEAVKDISMLHKKFYDAVIIGHYHNGREVPSNEGKNGDSEILVCPSFIGSDNYSESVYKANKAAVKIYGFDSKHGHTETYKIVLN